MGPIGCVCAAGDTPRTESCHPLPGAYISAPPWHKGDTLDYPSEEPALCGSHLHQW